MDPVLNEPLIMPSYSNTFMPWYRKTHILCFPPSLLAPLFIIFTGSFSSVYLSIEILEPVSSLLFAPQVISSICGWDPKTNVSRPYFSPELHQACVGNFLLSISTCVSRTVLLIAPNHHSSPFWQISPASRHTWSLRPNKTWYHLCSSRTLTPHMQCFQAPALTSITLWSAS